MNRCLLLLFAFCLWIANGAAPALGQDEPKTDKKEPMIKLPKDNSRPVIVFDLAGGFRMANPKGFTRTPRLRIFPDGKVLTGRNVPRVAEVEYRLTKEQLEKLLEFVVNENDFFQLTTESVRDEIKKVQPQNRIADAPSSRFQVNLADRTNNCEIYALFFVAKQFPTLDRVQRLKRIESRLQTLHNRAQFGDDQQLDVVMTAINQSLKKESPKSKLFEKDDLQSAYQTNEKAIRATFVRYALDQNGKKTQRVQASVVVEVTQAPEVKISLTPIPTVKQ